ncbi:eukaryotic translation initiation factor 2B beta [Volvox carteri f. nagariensis]|uniref:Translation initiation factor eIF2B subunit beta n=1 Tax=Volvox carteri f. nagariensis TaxID=3068 RepID=D8UGV7_VOLCA|nr:eukaryotic translation initiation factor 2B beta [Volvox carteri f. nagariensis]EFJ41048.1 eukaryotic translation initiation factor 2B beta [Volvox carteri f. nagariensis]|eukprot:XP_002957912.1 eukaryotic translation initiation factor 2B beta [Volvox carteri f. nagariensis]
MLVLRQIEGSLPCAKKTLDVLRLIVTNKKHSTAAALIDEMRSVGYKMQTARPVELAIGNMVRRVLHIIREEAKQEEFDDVKPTLTQPSTQEAMRNPVCKESWHRVLLSPHEVIESINELIDELDHIQGSITAQGVEHIHANEVILTMGMSDTTYLFLKEAAKKREFQVVVAEGAPRFDGHLMARRLADAGIQTTLIADSAVYAMMARANKVLVGAHAVLANGGVVAPVGMHLVALSARRHSIPFVVLVGLHKLSPLFPTDPDLLYNAATAGGVGAPPRWNPLPGNVHVPTPLFDYVPPHLISLFITDMGGRTPSYVYRLLTEYYSRNDYFLSREVFGKDGVR